MPLDTLTRLAAPLRPWGLCLLLNLLSPLVACTPAPEPAAPAAQSWSLAVLKVAASTPMEYSAAGQVSSESRLELSARLPGTIVELPVREGDAVRKGQVLVRLEAAEAEAAVRQAQAALASTQAAAQQAQTELDRFQRLLDSGSLSDNEWRRAQLRRDTAREAQHQAQAGLDMAQAQRDHSVLRSPLDGVVVARHHQVGDLATPGQPLLSLDSGRGSVFETYLPESQAASVAAGQTVQVQLDGLPALVPGQVLRVVPVVDPLTRNHLVRIQLAPAPTLRPGQFGRALFLLGQSANPSLPRRALLLRGGLQGVYTVDEHGSAHFRWLRIGREWPDRVEVTAGLNPGDRVVAEPDPALREGDHIAALEAAR